MILILENGGSDTVSLTPVVTAVDWANITSIPTDIADGDDVDTNKLTEAQVDAFVANNGYLTSEVDGSITNEIQDLQLSGNTLTITNNGAATNIDLSGYLDNTDNQQILDLKIESDNLILILEDGGSDTVNLSTVSTAADWSNITNIPTDIADGDDNTQLSEAEVDGFVANNGYLTSEVDGSITNEIQDLQISGDTLTVTNNGSATNIDLSGYLDNTDNQQILDLKIESDNLILILEDGGSDTVDLTTVSTDFWSLQGNAGTNVASNLLGTTDSVGLSIGTNNIGRLFVSPTGNVGIGTATPDAQFQVLSTANRGFRVTEDFISHSDQGGGMIRLRRLGGAGSYRGGAQIRGNINGSNRGEMIFYVTQAPNTETYTEVMKLDAIGNLGIGTSTPGATLDVNGNFRLNTFPGNHDSTGTNPYVLWVDADNTHGTELVLDTLPLHRILEKDCPVGMSEVDAHYCIDNTNSATQGLPNEPFWMASKACRQSEKRLCDATELVYASELRTTTGNIPSFVVPNTTAYEWTGSYGNNTGMVVRDSGSGWNTPDTQTNLFSDPFAYRCCFSR